MRWHHLASSIAAVVAVLAAGCGGAQMGSGARPPGRPPDIVGIITHLGPAVVHTEDCVQPGDRQPDEPVSSTDPPLCTGPTPNDLGQVLVEAEPHSDRGDKTAVRIPHDAVLLAESQDGYREIGFGELEVGQFVRAWFEGPLLESYPVKATGTAVVVSDAPGHAPNP